MSIGDRLREERTRLSLSQELMGESAGVRKQAQLKYEKGERSPDAAYLGRLAEIGVDVLYVLTGRRAPSVRFGVAEPDPVGPLNLAEIALLNAYRRLDAKGRQAVSAMLDALAQNAPAQAFNGPVQSVAGRDVKQITTGDVTQGKGGRIG